MSGFMASAWPDLMINLGRGGWSGYAELVALGVAQHDRVAPHVLVHPGDAGARLHQLLHFFADQSLAFFSFHLTVGHPDVEVNPVLGGLPLGHALEIHPRPLVGRVDNGGLVAELLLRHADGPAEIFPGLEAMRRRLEHVVQRESPEVGELGRLGGVDDHLDLEVHGQAPLPSKCHRYRSRSSAISAPRCSISRLMCSTSVAMGWSAHGPSAGPTARAMSSGPRPRTPPIHPA